MMTGMLLGVIFYRPIYQHFLDSTDYKTQQKTELVSTGKSEIKIELIKDSKDSLMTVKTPLMLKDGAKFNELRKTKIAADGTKSKEEITQVDKELSAGNFWIFVALVFFQILLVTMVYGPIAAFLVELFPTKIRYTSMSLPYHIGNGVFGGLVPFIATLVASFPGSTPLSGLWYPIGVASLCLIIGTVYLSNKRHTTED
jgi:hypothetical protein